MAKLSDNVNAALRHLRHRSGDGEEGAQRRSAVQQGGTCNWCATGSLIATASRQSTGGFRLRSGCEPVVFVSGTISRAARSGLSRARLFWLSRPGADLAHHWLIITEAGHPFGQAFLSEDRRRGRCGKSFLVHRLRRDRRGSCP
jgi:hypothetical protein